VLPASPGSFGGRSAAGRHGVVATYPRMVARGSGHIVNTASAAGLAASGLLTSYVATKHAVVGLSLTLRTEAAGYGVGVTAVCPTAVDTPILDKGSVGRMVGRDVILSGQRISAAPTRSTGWRVTSSSGWRRTAP
jgi:short-subunit dehydrogenase